MEIFGRFFKKIEILLQHAEILTNYACELFYRIFAKMIENISSNDFCAGFRRDQTCAQSLTAKYFFQTMSFVSF